MVKNRQSAQIGGSVPQVPFARRKGSAFGVEAVDLAELRSRQLDHSIFRPHRIDFHILVLITGGQGWHMVDFNQHPVERGSLVHIAPGQVQRYDGEHDVLGFLVLFQPEVGGIEAPQARWPALLEPMAGDFETLESLAQLMLDLKTRAVSGSPDRIAWRMLAAVLELCEGVVARQLSKEGAPSRSVEFEAFDALLNENFGEHRELSWYAQQLGYSERTLSRWCQRVLGINAKAHIDQRVALEAKRILVHSDPSVESIAARLGFSEATNFVKFFKRVAGTTPSAFRQSFQGDLAKSPATPQT